MVENEPLLQEFLCRRIASRDVRVADPKTRGLVELLLAQGCVTYDATKPDYSFDEVGYIVGALASQWYGVYYSHPFWERLRRGDLSVLEVFGWVLRTYHLSRSAGATAARGAIHSPRPDIRATFLKSALEEYSHCEAYYFPRHRVFGLDDEWIKELLPLPSNTAFDQQMSIIAEDDWLAHTITAYFQEYTAAFRDNAFRLYDQIERTYGLDGFFAGWKQHVGYDVDQTHADDFADLLQGEARIGRDDLIRSIDAAATQIQFLVGALDEMSNIDGTLALKDYRTAPAHFMRGATRTSVLGGLTGLDALFDAQCSGDLAERLVRVVRPALAARTASVLEVLAVVLTPRTVSDLGLRALSRAVEHDHILSLGCVIEAAEAAEGLGANLPSCACGIRAVANNLRESTANPGDFLFLIGMADRLRRALTPECNEAFTFPDFAATGLHGTQLGANEIARLAGLGLRFVELCEAATRLWARPLPQDLLLAEDG